MLTTRVARNENAAAKARTKIAGRKLLRICSVTVSFCRSSSAEFAAVKRMGMVYSPTSRGVKVSITVACSLAGTMRPPVVGAVGCDDDAVLGDVDAEKKSGTGWPLNFTAGCELTSKPVPGVLRPDSRRAITPGSGQVP